MLKLASSKAMPRLLNKPSAHNSTELHCRDDLPENIRFSAKVSAKDFRAEILSVTFPRGVYSGTAIRISAASVLEDRQAKITDLQSALSGDQDVSRLQIQMQDPQRMDVS